jgi:predicted chitinase
MPMGMMRKADPTLDIDSLQSRLLDKLDLRPPEGSVQDIQYGLDSQKLGEVIDRDEDVNVVKDTPNPDDTGASPKPELGGLMAPKGSRDDIVFAQEYLGVTVDSKIGPQTSITIANFQYDNNIPISGQVDDETIKAMQNPDTLDPRKPNIKLDNVLNSEGTLPDIEKLKAWSKKNIKDPMRAAAFVATVEAESGTGLIEAGHTLTSAIRTFVTNNPDMHVDRNKDKPLTAKGKRRKQKLEALGSDASGDEIFDFIYGTDPDAIGNMLGNTQDSDGSTFKGRGIIQLSGRENYQKVGDILGLDLINTPELVNDPKHAAAVAITYLTLPGKNFFTGEIDASRLAQIVGHSGGDIEARNRFRRATELKEEMYN